MFPLSDDNPRVHIATPYVNYAIIALCTLAFLWQVSQGQAGEERTIVSLGMIPARLFGYGDLPAELVVVPAWATILTSMFLHGGWLHLGGNMLYLWIFGDNIEDSMGHFRYIVFYLLCGIAAALTQGFVNPASEVPMVGASGAISGVLGAYILLHPRATVRVFLIFGFFVRVMHVPAMLVLGIWFALQLLSGLATRTTAEGGVAVWAHVGGFIAGLALIMLFKRSWVEVLEKPKGPAFEIERRRGPWG